MGSLSSPTPQAFFKEEGKVLGWGLKWWMPGPVKHKLLQTLVGRVMIWTSLALAEVKLVSQCFTWSKLQPAPPAYWCVERKPTSTSYPNSPRCPCLGWKEWRKQHPWVIFCLQISLIQDKGSALQVPAGLSREDTCSPRTSGHKPDHKMSSWALGCPLHLSQQQ